MKKKLLAIDIGQLCGHDRDSPLDFSMLKGRNSPPGRPAPGIASLRSMQERRHCVILQMYVACGCVTSLTMVELSEPDAIFAVTKRAIAYPSRSSFPKLAVISSEDKLSSSSGLKIFFFSFCSKLFNSQLRIPISTSYYQFKSTSTQTVPIQTKCLTLSVRISLSR